MDPDVRRQVAHVLVPLRHLAWGANQINTFVCGYGYGVAFTQPCLYHAMDNLGIAQYLSRLGLLLAGPDALTKAKAAWQDEVAWQGLRRWVEDLMCDRDPYAVFFARTSSSTGCSTRSSTAGTSTRSCRPVGAPG